MLSVIILTCDSHKSKALCVRHCIQSIFNQTFDEYEIILVDNGNDDTFNLSDHLSIFTSNRHFHKTKWLKTSKTINRGAARNYGAQNAAGDILIFIDEDVILTDQETFVRINQYSSQHIWGCGAVRLWTKGDWFVTNSEEILNYIQSKDYEAILANSGSPEVNIRGAVDINVESRSFIGHFGFCRKIDFEAVGGFVDLHPANSFDDDLLNIKLFQSSGKPKLFDDVTIVHVNHPIHGSRTDDYYYYFSHIVEQGVFSFDSEALIFGRDEKLLQELLPIHQSEILLKAFSIYKQKVPLNAGDLSPSEIDFWKANVALELDDYCRVAHRLLQQSTIDEFVGCYAADFDNLGPVIESLLESEILGVSIDGKIIQLDSLLGLKSKTFLPNEVYKFQPDQKLNQFPCSPESLDRRLEFLKQRYPFAEFLRVGIIGDDDLLSHRMQNEIWMYPITIEKDERLVDALKRLKKGRVYDLDLLCYNDPSFVRSIEEVPRVHTFITDPPYTLHGILLFVWVGLGLLERNNSKREFYVVVNPMLIGRPLEKLIGILADAGASLASVIENFSTYPLPEHYPEKTRAMNFSKQYGLNSPKLSSTSNLYIFTTSNPNLELIRSYLDSDLVYEHYKL